MADFSFSVLTPALRADSDDSTLARVLERALRAIGEKDRWEVKADGHWCYLTRNDSPRRTQGWKLHVSATMASAETVLARSLPVLLGSRSPFKFARTLDHVALLNTRHTPRGHSGKFVTVYPCSDDEAVQLAADLHQVSAGLAGPRILSDQPYAPGSLVHYRYGAFVEERRISNDGFYAWTILDPDGNPVEDRRVGQYLPPAWAKCPFPQPAANGARNRAKDKTRHGVLIGERFLTQEAIRHSNKGGIYRAVDTRTGSGVVIKEARPHVATDEAGRDARDLLRGEARALEMIGPLGVAPRVLALFEQGQHLFLAEDLVPGLPLRDWIPDLVRTTGWRRSVPEPLALLHRLVDLMATVHQAGLIVRDFNPNNIMVLPERELRLIDLELAVPADCSADERVHVGTPGYAAPEQMAGAQPAFEADYYSLGATLCFVLTGDSPFLLDEVPQSRSLRERLTEWLAVRGKALDISDEIQTVILGLMDDVPERRWTPVAARKALTMAQQRAGHVPPVRPARADGGLSHDELCRQAVDGTLNYLLSTMNLTEGERLWPVSCAFGAPDPCSLQLGAPGILGVLTQYLELVGDQRVADALAAAGGWLAGQLAQGAKRPPGLYFGDAGIAWSLYEAGRVLGDATLVGHALTLADTLPLSWSSPDLMQGTAGIGTTFLHLWLRTGNREFLERAGKAAEVLITSVNHEGGELIWEPPAEYDSRLTGRRTYGYAHGTAGVGYFLLAAAVATGRPDCLALACRAGDALLAKMTVVGGDTGEQKVAHWGAGPGDPPTAPYWCHGASGIGTFLARLHRVSGDNRFGEAAEMSANAVLENSWRGSLGQCHGLAGNGEFLLDMARCGDTNRYEAAAHELAEVILTTRTHRKDQVVFPNEHQGVSATWGDGVSGILSFFLRLRHHSPRLWMVDALFERNGLS